GKQIDNGWKGEPRGWTPYLQIERRGQELFLRLSKDGREWTALRSLLTKEPRAWNLPKSLKVGILAFANSPKEVTLVVEDFKLKRPEPADRPRPGKVLRSF